MVRNGPLAGSRGRTRGGVALACLLAPRRVQSAVRDLLNPSPAEEAGKHKLKRLVQSPNSYFMDIKCPGCTQMCVARAGAGRGLSNLRPRPCRAPRPPASPPRAPPARSTTVFSHAQTVVVCGGCVPLSGSRPSALVFPPAPGAAPDAVRARAPLIVQLLYHPDHPDRRQGPHHGGMLVEEEVRLSASGAGVDAALVLGKPGAYYTTFSPPEQPFH